VLDAPTRALILVLIPRAGAVGGTVFVPNRTIGSVINYPRGYVRCFAST
jgi:small conductance mechanosensitive channel